MKVTKEEALGAWEITVVADGIDEEEAEGLRQMIETFIST